MSLQTKLIELNRLDLRVRGLRSRLDANQRRHGLQDRKLQQLRQQLTELDDQIKHDQAKTSSLEKQVAEAEARIEELRGQMNTITNNKQYQAVLVEVNTLKVDKEKVEEEALSQMTHTEGLTAEREGLAAKVEDQARLVEQAQQDVETARSEVAESLAEAENEMRDAATDIPREVLTLYSRLSDENEGEAIGYVEEHDRKRMEFTCSVSNVVLPPEMVNALLTTPDVIQQCPSSGVILVMDPKVSEALAGSK